MAFVFFEKKPSTANLKKLTDYEVIEAMDNKMLSTPLSRPVRRPVYGIAIKSERHAGLSIITSEGEFRDLINGIGSKTPWELGGSDKGKQHFYTDFILTAVHEERAEKAQIISTFGEDFLYIFGENPRMLLCSGVLINDSSMHWVAEWWENYDQYLRGTKLIEQNARAYLSFDDVIVEGYVLGGKSIHDANNPYQVIFTFTFFITNYTNVCALNFDALSQAVQKLKEISQRYISEYMPMDIATGNPITMLLADQVIQKALETATKEELKDILNKRLLETFLAYATDPQKIAQFAEAIKSGDVEAMKNLGLGGIVSLMEVAGQEITLGRLFKGLPDLSAGQIMTDITDAFKVGGWSLYEDVTEYSKLFFGLDRGDIINIGNPGAEDSIKQTANVVKEIS